MNREQIEQGRELVRAIDELTGYIKKINSHIDNFLEPESSSIDEFYIDDLRVKIPVSMSVGFLREARDHMQLRRIDLERQLQDLR
jgi:hypothetical protein